MEIVCVGDCGVDRYLPSGERHFGGITANFARHAHAEFQKDDVVRIVSCIGNDDDGLLVRDALRDSAVECDITTLEGRTPVQHIEIRPDGEKHFVRYEEGVLRNFHFTASQRRLIAGSDLLVAPVYLQIVRLFDELMSVGTAGITAVDFADFLEHPDYPLLDRYVDRIDIGFFGLTADDHDAIDAIARRAARHDKLYIVTLGPDGSLACHRNGRVAVPAVPVESVVDTTGAGDAYAAGFLSRWCHGAGIQEAMEHGAALACRVITRLGSCP
ncbi:MAG TPA: carbohydrate kinase family protein [Woeseiaceae bacterium]|nr:carbohydrate kinase family protein [Woeseiaceae bacterium]